MTNDTLLIELQRRNLLAPDVASRIERESILSGKLTEEIIYDKKVLDDRKIAEIKSQLVGVPYQKINFSNYSEDLMSYIPEETVRTYGVVPLEKQKDLLVVGMFHPDDLKAQEALKYIAHEHRLNLGVYVISYSDWQEVLRKYSPYKVSIENAVKVLKDRAGEFVGAKKVIQLDEIMGNGEEAPIIKIVSDTFREALQSRASDVHFEPQQDYFRIRFRVDGDLKEAASLPPQLAQPIVSRIKVISSLKIDETRIPQDGRFGSRILDREIDFRVATFPTPMGEKVAVRILDPNTGLKNFDQLGFNPVNLRTVKEGLEKPYGMILVTGPTGSGKSTSLYALLQSLNNESVNIVSLEDPVEYFVAGINQSQVRPEIGYDFASGLRQILRQDPDVIMVGEIRDTETASLAIQAALTGHIVLSTLHTNNSAGVIPRLIDMKVEPFLLPVSLNLMISQRLVGLLCESCKKKETAPEGIQKIIEKSLEEVPEELKSSYKKPYEIYHAPGCKKCKGKGIMGRIAIMEVMKMTPSLEEIIIAGPTLQKVENEAKKQGMVNMRQDGILKALQGLVSMEEVMRASEDE